MTEQVPQELNSTSDDVTNESLTESHQAKVEEKKAQPDNKPIAEGTEDQAFNFEEPTSAIISTSPKSVEVGDLNAAPGSMEGSTTQTGSNSKAADLLEPSNASISSKDQKNQYETKVSAAHETSVDLSKDESLAVQDQEVGLDKKKCEEGSERPLAIVPETDANLSSDGKAESLTDATPAASSKLVTEHEQLREETTKVESAIKTLEAPALPSRTHIGNTEVYETPTKLATTEELSAVQSRSPVSPPLPARHHTAEEVSTSQPQSPVSPPLPARHHTKRQQYAVPPPLEEEMRSERFRKNLALANIQPPVSSVSPAIHKAKRLESAAEINLIANRLRRTSRHYQKEDDSSKENLEKGKNILISSYSTILESMPSTPIIGNDKTATMADQHDVKAEDSNKPEEAVDWEFWTQVVNDFPSVASDPERLEAKVTDGIPSPIRGIIWQLVANSKSKEFEDIYQTLLVTKSPHEANISRDLKRTKHLPEDKTECLFNILKVYSVYDPDVGYTQGMAFIATPLILNCKTESEALGLLIRLMKTYGLRDFFLPDMPGLMLMLYQFDRLLEESSPQLYNHLTRQGVRSSMYATQWFLTFFAYKFPLGFVLRIFDIVFIEGIESILRFAVNLMLKNSKNLIVLNFDRLLDYLKNELFNYYLKDFVQRRNQLAVSSGETESNDGSDTGSVLIKKISYTSQFNGNTSGSNATFDDDDYDIELFVHEAMHDVHVTPISLQRYAAEYDDIHQIEQQKEAQYESIKIKNLQLQKEVRKLEHEYTLLNKEHVEIANELIKNRLKIETLADENNDQKLYILELKKRLDEEIRKQALPNPDAALPVDLRADIDKTIRRNAEVMNENARLQDKINEQETIILELREANKAGTHAPSLSPKPPLVNGWSGLKKVFK